MKNNEIVMYLKGHSNDESNNRIVVAIYDEPQFGILDDDYIAIATNLSDGSRKFLADQSDVYSYVAAPRVITASEYTYLVKLSKLQTELFMNQYTGGFPRPDDCLAYSTYLHRWIGKVIDEQLNSKG